MPRWLRPLSLVVAAILVSAVVWLLQVVSERDSRLPRLALQINDERRRARAAHLPLDPTRLPARPARKESENAAPFYREATEYLPEWTSEDWLALRHGLDPTADLTVADKKRLEELLTGAAPAVLRVRQGYRRPYSDFGWAGLHTEEEWLRRRAVLLDCDRLARAMQLYALGRLKDPQQMLLVLEVVERFTRHVSDEGGLLVWQSRAYHTVLAAHTLSLIGRNYPERRTQVQRALESWEPTAGALKKTWRVQCVKEELDSQLARTRQYKKDKQPFLDYNPLWRELDRVDHALGWKLYADATETIHLRYWRRVQEVLSSCADSDLPAQWRALRDLDREEDARGKQVPGYWYPQRYSNLAAQLLSAQLTLRLARIELALASTNPPGTDPTALGAQYDLRDPFRDQPLLWKAPLLYSVGPNGIDDGGDPIRDVVWNLEASAAPLSGGSRRALTRRPGRGAGRAE